MEEQFINRRDFIRVPFNTLVIIESGSWSLHADSDIDVSMNGLRVKAAGTKSGPLPGSRCKTIIMLQTVRDRITIQTEGKVVRVEPEEVAVEFDGIDLESYRHLSSLILYNAKNPDKAEKEIADHIGIRRTS